MADRRKIELPDGALIWVPPGMPRSAVGDFVREWHLAVDREQVRDGALCAELDKVRGKLAETEGERNALEEALAQVHDALSPVGLVETEAMVDAIASMRAQLDRAKRMLVKYGYDVELHDMDGGLRAALADLTDSRRADADQRYDYDLLVDIIAQACPDVLSTEAARGTAERALIRLALTDGVIVVRGPDGTPWTPDQQGGGQKAALIETDPVQLRLRRLRALRSVGLTEDELRRRVETGSATPDEREAWLEVETATFLLGGSQ